MSRRNFFYYFFLLTLLLVITVGCASKTDYEGSLNDINIPDNLRELENVTIYSTGEGPTSQIELIQEVSFGEMLPFDGSTTIGRKIAVDDTGRVFLVDMRQKLIQVFGADGTHLKSIGRSGRGPGEFISITEIDISGDELLVNDPSQQRVQFFSLKSLDLSHILILDPNNWTELNEVRGSPVISDNDDDSNNLIARFNFSHNGTEQYIGYYLIDRNGNILSDRIFEQKINTETTLINIAGFIAELTMPYVRTSIMDIRDDGYIFSSWTEEFLIKVYNSQGDYLYAFYYPYIKKKIKPEDVIDRFDSLLHQSILRRVEFPETWPALQSLLVDDEGRLWVSTITEDNAMDKWWILSEFGELVATFTWPIEKSIEIVKNGYLYTRETDEMGVVSFVRYRIDIVQNISEVE